MRTNEAIENGLYPQPEYDLNDFFLDGLSLDENGEPDPEAKPKKSNEISCLLGINPNNVILPAGVYDTLPKNKRNCNTAELGKWYIGKTIFNEALRIVGKTPESWLAEKSEMNK